MTSPDYSAVTWTIGRDQQAGKWTLGLLTPTGAKQKPLSDATEQKLSDALDAAYAEITGTNS